MKMDIIKRRRGTPRPVADRFPRRSRYVPSLVRLEHRVLLALGTFELDGNATTQTTHDWDQVYNDAVLTYDTALETVPTNIVAAMFRFEERQYFELEEPAAREAPQVSF